MTISPTFIISDSLTCFLIPAGLKLCASKVIGVLRVALVLRNLRGECYTIPQRNAGASMMTDPPFVTSSPIPSHSLSF